MASVSAYPPDYAPLLTGEHGFILALGVFLLITVLLAFLVKSYFTYGRFKVITRSAGPAATVIRVSDGIWFAAHILAFVYFGLRLSTIGGLTEDTDSLSESQRARLGKENLTASILFILVEYLSSCSVLCLAIAIPSVTRSKDATLQSPTYLATTVVFLLGLVLDTLPRIGCSPQHIFPGLQGLCSSPSIRVMPSIILLVALEFAITTRWVLFVYRHSIGAGVGRVTRRQAWPVEPFVFRLLNCVPNVTFLVTYSRFSRSETPYYNTLYSEMPAVALNLILASSVSLSRILSKLNFSGGIAYNMEPGTRSYTQSGLEAPGASRSGKLDNVRRQSRIDHAEGWKDQAAKISNRIRAGRKNSGESEVEILRQNEIKCTVDIQQQAEEASNSGHSKDSF